MNVLEKEISIMLDTRWVPHSCHEFLEFDTFNTGSVNLLLVPRVFFASMLPG